MRMQQTFSSTIRRAIVVGTLALASAGHADAVTFDFNQFLSGGGGGPIQSKEGQTARGAGAHVCVDVTEARETSGNRVIFYIWSAIPQPKSRLTTIAFDTGRHTDLFRDVSVVVQPRGVKAQVTPGQSHAFLRSLTPDFTIRFSRLERPAPGQLAAGLAPGNSIMLAATLGPGKTFANVISALTEGLNPATASSGLRLGVIVAYLLGGPPPGVGSIHDDGGFVIQSGSRWCRRS